MMFGFCSCAQFHSTSTPRQEPDVVVLVSPVSVKSLQGKPVVDAIENPENAATPKALVLFKIERVLRGTIPQIKSGGSSKMDQAKEAFSNREYFKIITADFSDVSRLVDKEWLSVAVADPSKTFQISSWENPGSQRYKIRLKPVIGRPGSYVMIGSEPKG